MVTSGFYRIEKNEDGRERKIKKMKKMHGGGALCEPSVYLLQNV